MKYLLIFEQFLDNITDSEEAKKIYRKFSKKFHPDSGEGNEEDMKILNNEYERFKKNYTNGNSKGNTYHSTTSNSTNSFNMDIVSSMPFLVKKILQGRNVEISDIYDPGLAYKAYCLDIKFNDSTMGIIGSSSVSKVNLVIYYRNSYDVNKKMKTWGLNYTANNSVSKHVEINTTEELENWLVKVLSKFKPNM